jgi:Fic family protein
MANFTDERLLNPTGHPIEQAARAHFDLVSIHPFVDGNGRTARLIMNLILLKHGYFPTIILKNDRKKYYDALEKGRQKNNVDDFIFLTGRALERTIYLYLEVIPEIKTHFLTLSEAAKLSPYSQDYLGILARRGSIPAFKLKRNWVITQEALQRYVHDQKNQK